MRNLADEQIDFIAEDIRRRGVFSQSLQEDLLDHICCYIEEQPDDERPFGEIYQQALDAFGHNGLQAIQDETLLLINQPYQRAMKKFAYITGALASTMLLAGAFFKIMHWPGASILLILGTVTLSMFFIPYFFYVNLKEQSEKKSKIIAATGLITALFLCAATLFKMMHWPGTIVLMSGFGLSFLVFLPLYIINGIRNPLTKVSSISNGFLFAAIGGFVLLISFQQPGKNVSDSPETMQANEEKLLVELYARFYNDQTAQPYRYAMTQFVRSCDYAIQAVNPDSLPPEIVNGRPVTGKDLNQLNDNLRKAVNRLNEQMNMYAGWNRLSFEDIQPTLYGSAKFQVLQLKERAYVNALGN